MVGRLPNVAIQPAQPPLLGILGGMGPLATVDFLGKLTRALPVGCDQEHLPWITLSQPGMPDRSRAIENGDDGPLPYLVQGVTYLAAQGVRLIAIPCSTSHYWFDRVQPVTQVPILHIADAAIEALRQRTDCGKGPIAVLATRGAIRSQIYERRILAAGFEVGRLAEVDQCVVDGVIHDVKAGKLDQASDDLQRLQATLKARSVATLILGCTELPLVYQGDLPAIDVTLSLAEAALRRLGYLTDGTRCGISRQASGAAS